MSEEKIMIPIERKLKECPFCGGEAVVHAYSHDPDLPDRYSVFCKKCLCELEVSTNKKPFYTKVEAIEAWNHRFAPDTNDGSKELGEWVHEEYGQCHCSECGYTVSEYEISPYCPQCGAMMDWSE